MGCLNLHKVPGCLLVSPVVVFADIVVVYAVVALPGHLQLVWRVIMTIVVAMLMRFVDL